MRKCFSPRGIDKKTEFRYRALQLSKDNGEGFTFRLGSSGELITDLSEVIPVIKHLSPSDPEGLPRLYLCNSAFGKLEIITGRDALPTGKDIPEVMKKRKEGVPLRTVYFGADIQFYFIIL